MMPIAMSPAAAGLLRAVLARAAVDRGRILLTEFRSTDWQSLTFVGERHQFQLRITGADAREILSRVTCGLNEAEFEIPGQLVADIVLSGEPRNEADGSVSVAIEALTVAAN